MYRVFEVETGYEIFWCPSAPVHFADKVPYDGKVYSTRSAAYRKAKKLTDGTAKAVGRPAKAESTEKVPEHC